MTDSLAQSWAVMPGLARVAGSAYLNALGWSARTALATSARVARASTDAAEAAELAREVMRAAEVVRETTMAVANGVPVSTAIVAAAESLTDSRGEAQRETSGRRPGRPGAEITEQSLRDRGAALLERSRDVTVIDDAHPAFDRILDELAPDEARVLLLLLRGGPQPSVDVRTGGPIGRASSHLIAPGLSMIGMRAGVRRDDQVPAYLNNLFRLGLIWFSKEPLRDAEEYQVVEAQPDVLAAVHSVKFAKVVRRSIHLTPFGEDFCRACLVDESTAAVANFPEHEVPETD